MQTGNAAKKLLVDTFPVQLERTFKIRLYYREYAFQIRTYQHERQHASRAVAEARGAC